MRTMGPPVLLITVAILAGFVVASSDAWAAQGAPSGQNVLTCEIKSMSLDEGHSFMIGNWKGLVVTVPESPDHMAQIDCLGTFESMADKSFKASGYCVITDRDGDKVLDRWWADSTMPRGRWEDTGISGKWNGFRATGSYVYTDRSTPSECRGFSKSVGTSNAVSGARPVAGGRRREPGARARRRRQPWGRRGAAGT